MSSVKTWRRAALLTYIAAGAALPLAGYALATTQANMNAIEAAQQRLSDTQRHDQRTDEHQASAAGAAGAGVLLDSRPYSPVVDWSTVAGRVMPSVVMVSVIEQARGDGSRNRAWLIPGVQINQATAWLTRYRAWQSGWTKLDQARKWETMGAGFVIGDGRQVATAGHVISGAEAVRVKLAGGEWRAARVVGVDLAQDVALLQIEGEPARSVAIAPAMPPQGQGVAAIGAPNGWGYSLSAGLVSRYGSAAGMFATRPMLQIAVPVAGGNSGGVVINARGEAVGMVSFGLPAFNQAVPIGRVLDVAAEIERRAAIIDPCKARANGEACG
jgi:serine protease Do